ncbi:MAG: hypothetical protein VXW65_04615 [Pseudomonadota bacterium]|nr:hypothetical protein [Pseudomonadota bacterium]
MRFDISIQHLLCVLGLSIAVMGCSSKNTQPTVPVAVPTVKQSTSDGMDAVVVSLESAVHQNVDDASSWGLLARAYYGRQQYTRAIQAADEALRLNNDDPDLTQILWMSSLLLSQQQLQHLQRTDMLNAETQEIVQAGVLRMHHLLHHVDTPSANKTAPVVAVRRKPKPTVRPTRVVQKKRAASAPVVRRPAPRPVAKPTRPAPPPSKPKPKSRPDPFSSLR